MLHSSNAPVVDTTSAPVADSVDVDEHNDGVFAEYFKSREEWTLEYVESDDYAGEYAYLMSESDQLNRSVRKLLRDYDLGDKQPDDLADDIACRILADGLFDFHVVDEYSSECCGYLDSFQVGEYEDQVEVDCMREEIGDQIIGDFFDVLEEWLESQRDFCLRHWGSTPLRSQKYPTVYLITYTALRIDYVVDEEALEELLEELLPSDESEE